MSDQVESLLNDVVKDFREKTLAKAIGDHVGKVTVQHAITLFKLTTIISAFMAMFKFAALGGFVTMSWGWVAFVFLLPLPIAFFDAIALSYVAHRIYDKDES